MRTTGQLTQALQILMWFAMGEFLMHDTAWAEDCYRIHPSTSAQFEASIVVDPMNPNVLFASSSTYKGGFVSEGIYVSTNAGQTWSGNDTCNGPPIEIHNGEPGIAIDKDGTFVLVRWGIERELVSHYSTDRGLTWSIQRTMTVENQERSHLVSDAKPGSSYFGRTYAAWVRFLSPFAVYFAHTTDGARTWSSPVQINAPVTRSSGARITLDGSSNVYICWATVIPSSPYTEDYVGMALSTNGGGSWTVRANAFDMNGIAGLLPDKGNIKVKGLPKMDIDQTNGPRRGWIYIVTAQKDLAPSGADPDIVLNRSTDGGTTWSNGIRVNQDAWNNGKTQFFPSVHVDGYGAVNVVYYDDRNTTIDSTGVFLSRSTDGGNTWRDFHISCHNFKPAAIAGFGQGYVGDNIGLVSTGSTLWPVWMDNSTGVYQLWTVPIDLTILSVADERRSLPARYSLHQNYPNPFNPNCVIEYELPKAVFTMLAVYDVMGRKVLELARGEQAPGKHQVIVDSRSSSLPSGLYLYRLTTPNFSLTKKMLLLK